MHGRARSQFPRVAYTLAFATTAAEGLVGWFLGDLDPKIVPFCLHIQSRLVQLWPSIHLDLLAKARLQPPPPRRRRRQHRGYAQHEAKSAASTTRTSTFGHSALWAICILLYAIFPGSVVQTIYQASKIGNCAAAAGKRCFHIGVQVKIMIFFTLKKDGLTRKSKPHGTQNLLDHLKYFHSLH